MTVRRDGKCIGKGIAFFYEDLVADSTASWEKIDALGSRKRLDIRILGQILGRFVLDVVIKGEDCLSGKLYLRRPYRFEPNCIQTKKRKRWSGGTDFDMTGPVLS